jgi:hypothetical protein
VGGEQRVCVHFGGFPNQAQVQAVPTSGASDGAFYVSQLTASPFPADKANIFGVVPRRAPTVVASGLTNVIGLVFVSLRVQLRRLPWWRYGSAYCSQALSELGGRGRGHWLGSI